MTSTFDRWEKDPFFSAAEEVQESADRMESTYRTWIHAKKYTTSGGGGGVWNLDELRRDLRTTLGTTKWQLEEFERAARSSYPISSSSADDAKDRHRNFITAIQSQTKNVESSLNESSLSRGKPPMPWVRLDEGERNELALFLSGPSSSSTVNDFSRSSSNLVDLGHESELKGERSPGLRRAASASADIGSWEIMVADELLPPHSSSGVKKIPSFSGLLNTMESSLAKLTWTRNGYKKLKVEDHPQEEDSMLPKTQDLTRGVNSCFEKAKSFLYSDCYGKQLYGWCGTVQKQLQRSQYHIRYSRLVQVVFSVILLLCMLVLLALRTM